MAPTQPAGTAPYPAASLHAPLNRTERATVIAYVQNYPGLSFGSWWHSLTKNSTSKYIEAGSAVWSIELDYLVLAYYNSVVKNGKGLPDEPSGTAAVTAVPGDVAGRILGYFTNSTLWTRVAEFAVGGVLLAVGANAMLRGKR